jgi:hypothetical protein
MLCAHLRALPCLLILVCACGGGDTPPTAPSTVLRPGGGQPPSPTGPPPPTSTSALRVIRVGEEVTGTLTRNGADMRFELTAPSDGTLVAHLSWDKRQGTLDLHLEETLFFPSPPAFSSIVGTMPVVAGRSYRLTVADFAAWDYGGLFLPFVLTTSIQ